MADTPEKLKDKTYFAIGGEAKVISMDVWQMRSIWQELKYREGESYL